MADVFSCAREDGILSVTWDTPDSAVNDILPFVVEQLQASLQALLDDACLSGAILCSGKKGFCEGTPLNFYAANPARQEVNPQKSAQDIYARTMALTSILRQLETCGKPIVALLDGGVHGSGLEVALACHYRIATPQTLVSLPQIKAGIVPSLGATQRLPRLIGVAQALPVLLGGGELPAAKAQQMGMVHQVVEKDQLLATAKKWIATQTADATQENTVHQPWDSKRYKVPGGTPYTKGTTGVFVMGNALLHGKTQGRDFAAKAIMSAVYEGIQVPLEAGLRIEARYFAHGMAKAETGYLVQLARTVATEKISEKIREKTQEKTGVDSVFPQDVDLKPQLKNLSHAMAQNASIAACAQVYVQEGCAMLGEGTPPPLVENSAKLAGMHSPPLLLGDMLSFEKILQDWLPQDGSEKAHKLLETMVHAKGRSGKKDGKGFYDYRDKGERRLWPGLGDLLDATVASKSSALYDTTPLQQRFLYVIANQAAAFIPEPEKDAFAKADAALVRALGFPRWTGGPFAYIDFVGIKAFVAQGKALAKKHGARYQPCPLLVAMAEKDMAPYGEATAIAEAS